MAEYEPELGQAMFGAPWGQCEVTDFSEALFWGLWKEIQWVFWNRNQRKLDDYGNDDPKIPGLTIRPYWWGEDCQCEGGQHKPDCKLNLPNFSYGEVEIRWYKYPGRGMTCNVEWDEAQWRVWFDELLLRIRKADVNIGGKAEAADGE